MTFDFLIHDAVRVEYRVSVGEQNAPDLACIQSETRVPGGNGALAALALAKWGACVRLVGNPLGDDAHARFLRESLGATPNLHYQPAVRAEISTPYAILLRSPATIQTLLSPAASQITLESFASSDARVRIGPRLSSTKDGKFVDERTESVLAPETQNYASLRQALERAARAYLDVIKPDFPLERRGAFVDAACALFDERFDAISAVPEWEEIEARVEVGG